jgi:hypothetical protein
MACNPFIYYDIEAGSRNFNAIKNTFYTQIFNQ